VIWLEPKSCRTDFCVYLNRPASRNLWLQSGWFAGGPWDMNRHDGDETAGGIARAACKAISLPLQRYWSCPGIVSWLNARPFIRDVGAGHDVGRTHLDARLSVPRPQRPNVSRARSFGSSRRPPVEVPLRNSRIPARTTGPFCSARLDLSCSSSVRMWPICS
jgi:hypothetical protein